MAAAVSGGDRRAHVRFQIIGALPASVNAPELLTIEVLGTSGALVHGAVPLPVNGEYDMQLVLPAVVADATVKVRSVVPMADRTGCGRFQMALEFLAISPDAGNAIAQVVGSARVDT